MPDLVHYAIRFGVDQTEFLEASHRYLYNQTVFVFEPWEEIFVNDNERRMTFAKSVEFHDILVSVYTKLGYKLVQVPRGSIEERSRFVLDHLN